MASNEIRFSRTHCWVRPEGALLVVGLTDYAQEQMGELTYVELPEKDGHVEAEEEIAVVESAQAANDVFAPLAGTVVEVNEALLEQPELVNQEPFDRGWLFKMKPDHPEDFAQLLEADSYEALIPEDDE